MNCIIITVNMIPNNIIQKVIKKAFLLILEIASLRILVETPKYTIPSKFPRMFQLSSFISSKPGEALFLSNKSSSYSPLCSGFISIGLNTSIAETLAIMSEGNPGALRVLCEVYNGKIENLFLFLTLDDMNIRGWQIWVGYKDYCNQDLEKFIQAIRDRDSKMVDKINMEAERMQSPLRAVIHGASFGRT